MRNLHDADISKLEDIAKKVRISIIEMLTVAGSGHTAGPLGMTDIMAYLYFHALKHRPDDPEWPDRDRFVLSNGHTCPVLYAVMAHAGYFPVDELKTLRQLHTRLQGHPHREYLPGIETSSGPLGSGLSQAVGMALAERIDHGKTSDKFFYCFTGDGELNEGQNWEAIMLAAKERLHNLIVIVDRNNIQIDGNTEDVMPLNDLLEKFVAFNWHVQEIDGHNFRSIHEAVGRAQAIFDMPSVIIAHTIPGQGVDFMQRRHGWHGNPPGKGPEDVFPKDKQTEEALKELRA